MPQYALARAMDASAVLGPESLPDLAPGDAVQHVEWTVPLPGDAGVLTLHVSTTPNPEEWQLACSLSGMAGPALEDALVDVYGAGQELQQEGVPLKSLRAHPLALRTGSYEIRVAIGPTVHAIPLSLGGSSQTTEDG
jgi:hypothetical protein